MDPKFVEQGVRQILETVDSVVVRKVYHSAIRLEADKGFATELAGDAKLTKENADLISHMAAEVCAKHEIASQYAPEAFLIIGLGAWASQVAVVFRKLDHLVEEKRALSKGTE